MNPTTILTGHPLHPVIPYSDTPTGPTITIRVELRPFHDPLRNPSTTRPLAHIRVHTFHANATFHKITTIERLLADPPTCSCPACGYDPL